MFLFGPPALHALLALFFFFEVASLLPFASAENTCLAICFVAFKKPIKVMEVVNNSAANTTVGNFEKAIDAIFF